MYLVSVAPIKRGIPIEELSYFTKEEVPAGALVSVPLRGRITPGLVIRSIPAENAKAEIKQAEFTLKKLDRVRAKSFFRPEFIRAAERTARYFAASTGAVIQAVFPNTLLTAHNEVAGGTALRTERRHQQKFILQAEEAERFATYKSHIRETFAKNGSCYFILPSVQDIEHAYANLEKGIQSYTFTLHSGLSKKEIEKRWKAIGAIDHPVLIIGTPLFLSVPRDDIECVILDHESSGAYMTQARPFVDLRYYAEAFAEERGADIIFGDLFLRVETLERKERGEIEPMLRPKFRLPSPAKQSIVDMRTSGEQPATGRVAIASAELVDVIEATRVKGERCFILGVRRGIAPSTVCGDCGTIISCVRCAAPMVIHRKKKTPDPDERNPNIFLCHRCGYEADTDVICSHCGSWRLVPLGIGVAQAEELIRARFPDALVLRIDRDVVKKHAEAQKIIERFYKTPGAILIGTEMALAYLTEPVGAVAILSVNSLLTIPDFRMGERVFRLLLSLRERTREHFLIQTRDPDMPLFEFATSGNIGEFLRSELDVRQRLGYPPYSTLIKFTFMGGKVEGTAVMGEIEKVFGAYHPVAFPGFIAKLKGKYVLNALLKIPQGEWPNDELLGLIRALPPEVIVRVNPESVI